MSRVVIFDSGVGGLSIYQEVLKRCPNNDYIFFSDNKAFPYGTKTETELTDRVLQVIAVIDKEYSPDLVVVACNSASTVALEELRANFDLPFVGVVPAIKPAAKLTQTNIIGLLATPGTIARPYTQALIDEFAPNVDVVKIGSSKLVELAQQKFNGIEVDLNLLKTELSPFFNKPMIDTVVLACTHFPLLNNELSAIFQEKNHAVTLIDSGVAIANRVAQLGEKLGPENKTPNSTAVFSSEEISTSLLSYLKHYGFGKIEAIAI